MAEDNEGGVRVERTVRPTRFTEDAEQRGCLCWAEKRFCDGFYRFHEHHPDACPVHGWREDPTPERITECIRLKRCHQNDTNEYIQKKAWKA